MSSTCTIKVRLPDGKTIQGEFNEDDTLYDVKNFVNSNYSGNIKLMTTYPKCVYENSELKDFTLKDIGLTPKGALIAQLASTTDTVKKGEGYYVKPGVHHVKTESEYNSLKSVPNKLVVVDFSASWCGPCKMIAPFFESLAEKTPSVVFIHVDVDTLPNLPDSSDVSGVPTFKFFKNGSLLYQFSGASTSALEDSVNKYK